MLRAVRNMDTGTTLYFDATTPYEAMSKLVYYLSTMNGREALQINKTESGMHLYVDHKGQTYSIRNE